MFVPVNPRNCLRLHGLGGKPECVLEGTILKAIGIDVHVEHLSRQVPTTTRVWVFSLSSPSGLAPSSTSLVEQGKEIQTGSQTHA